ncbi:MAG: hypothetical protein OEM63_05140 [Gammaproteobacteria bacterium]|nr:hypothetical protein [Gammaproteobacteria bacterium]
MNMEKLNTTLALTANIGVLIGLFLVAFELRQNDDSLNASIQLSISQSYEQLATLNIEKESLHESLMEVFTGSGEISGRTAMTIMSWQYRYLMVLFTTYNLFLDGIVTEAFWREKVSHYTIYMLQSSRMREIHLNAIHEEMFSPEFNAALEAIYTEQLAEWEGAAR